MEMSVKYETGLMGDVVIMMLCLRENPDNLSYNSESQSEFYLQIS